jgi:hypothetical protein
MQLTTIPHKHRKNGMVGNSTSIYGMGSKIKWLKWYKKIISCSATSPYKIRKIPMPVAGDCLAKRFNILEYRKSIHFRNKSYGSDA